MIGRTLVALLAVFVLSGCTETTAEQPDAGPHSSGAGVPCVPPASGEPSPATPPAGGEPAPDVALACFAGGATVRLTQLGRPAIVNLWASWCEPCQSELPALNSYAQRVAGSVLVLGVATRDSRPRTQSVIDDLGITFPTLFDRDGELLAAVKRVNLPVTLFVTAGGTVAYVYNARALDSAGFENLARQHLGIP